MTNFIFIHGINNQNNSKENIEKTWSDALKKNSESSGVRMPDNMKFIAAYYGDVLNEETLSWRSNNTTSIPMSIDSPDEDFANEGVAELYLEFQKKYGFTDKQISDELNSEDNPTAKKRMAKGIHKRWLKAIARVLENILPAKGKKVVEQFLTQAAAYLHKPGLKEKIDDVVLEQIKEHLTVKDNVVIISHSLGTIIAYELLRRLRHEVQVDLLITAGSPLGIELVKRRLGPPLICLPNVKKWVNVSDKEDFVALKTILNGDNFGCDQINNNNQLDNGSEDAHDILKYLSHGFITQEIEQSISN